MIYQEKWQQYEQYEQKKNNYNIFIQIVLIWFLIILSYFIIFFFPISKKISKIPFINIPDNSESKSMSFNLINIMKDKTYCYRFLSKLPYYLIGSCKLEIDKALKENFVCEQNSNIEFNKSDGLITVHNVEKLLNNNILIGETFIPLKFGFWKNREHYAFTFQIYFIAYKLSYSNNYDYRIKVRKK
ncbi:hypothetical protein OC709_00935 ['Planchonia careya' phytoplasma]|nr:hypothetical protein ['Planchonia careya' phytoplasma]MDO8030083.1 hypothetical protein ['Planchonia careya' phytoplasma]